MGLLLCALVVLAGCRMDLHSKISERDANDMLGVLLAAGVDVEKTTPDGGKTWTISVDKAQTVRAIEVLRINALPRQRHETLGSLFKKEGLISSPTEERVRFIFGVEQELAQTVSSIDGVMVARVHIVLPNNDPLSKIVKPSSASVFVKHRSESDLTLAVPSIKNLVVHAIEGLSYDQVAVTLVPASAVASAAEPAAAREIDRAANNWWDWALAAGVAALGLVGVLAASVKLGWLKLPPAAMRLMGRLRGRWTPADASIVKALE